MQTPSVRATTVDGIFYPSEPDALETEVRRHLEAARTTVRAAPLVVVPHAAYEYVGPLVAEGFRAATGRAVRTVVALAPIHRDPPAGFVLPVSARFRCPLGDTEVDGDKVSDLLDCATAFTRNDIPHLEEHSIELLLPFLRVVFPQARLVPILTGRAGRKAVLSLSHALQMCFADRHETLIIVSANAATTVPRGRGSTEEADRFLELTRTRDWQRLLDETAGGRISCCGAHGLASVLAFGNIAATTCVLGRSVSSDETGERAVHYAALALG